MLPRIKINKKNFGKLNTTALPSPCFVIDLEILRQNLNLLKKIKEKTNVKILLALKAFSLKESGKLISKYLDGVSASGINEAILGRKFFSGIVSTYSPAFKETEMPDIIRNSNHIIFNSINQLNKFSKVKQINKKIEIGVRINPIYSEVKEKKYNAAGNQSRLGIHINQMKNIDFNIVDGLHFHSLCEQNFSTLNKTWEKIYPKIKNYFKYLKWINLGGGHHITREDYDIKSLTKFLIKIKSESKCDIFLEPGEAVVFQTGIIIGEILDFIKSSSQKVPNIAITDISPTCHMPDVLEAPYNPIMLNEVKGNHGKEVLIGGPSCLAGDNIGKYKFKNFPKIGDKIIFLDQAHYTLVKTNFFNGINHPSVALWDSKLNKLEIIKTFSYIDYEKSM